MKKKISHGDLFYYDFGEREGSIQSGVRPVLLEQIQTITIGFAQKQLRLEYHLKKMNK